MNKKYEVSMMIFGLIAIPIIYWLSATLIGLWIGFAAKAFCRASGLCE